MLKLTAMITWKDREAGGLTTKPFSGVQPSL